MRTINPIPTRLMRGTANATFRDLAEIWRNTGYGYEQVGLVRGSLHWPRNQPIPADPTDATAAQVEIMEFHHSVDIPTRIGDKIRSHGHEWVVGNGNFSDSHATFRKLMVARPIAATPRTYIQLRRWSTTLGDWEVLPPQQVQIAWSRNQPDRLGGVAVRQFGWIFAPEEAAVQLDVKQGDTFFYDGKNAVITWVPPDTAQRTEAIFSMNVGEGQ